ncbi:uncharacterized protein [Argopecten irradians]|uniref:uncharacterized protein n=1 Tax=Argopecten irradians TaxID=31199 RepID=UPI00371C1172
MEAVHLVLLAMVSLSYGDIWDITVSMSPITSPPANTDLSVTFYEREDDTSPGSAHTVTMEISIAIGSNVNMDDIHRPMKIDVWNGGEVPGYHFNQLSMTSASYQFTFECNCSLGIDGTKKVLYPKEDEWEIKITSSAVTNVGSFNYFTILVNDSNGVGQEIDSKFRRRQTTAISVLLHLDDPVSFKTFSFSGGGHTFCIKVCM